MNCRIFGNLPLILFVLLGSSYQSWSQELSNEEFRSALDPYVGIWKGEYRIYSQQDTLLNQFKVNRNYWWDGDVLQGRISYDFGQVKQTYFHRIILSEGVPFSFVTETAASKEIKSALKGELLKGTLVWSRVLPKGSLPVRVSERIVEGDEGKFIEFWGNQEAKDAQGDSFLVRIEGFAAYFPESRDFVVATEEVEPNPILSEEAPPALAGPIDKEERNRRFSALDPDRRYSSLPRDTEPEPVSKSQELEEQVLESEPDPVDLPVEQPIIAQELDESAETEPESVILEPTKPEPKVLAPDLDIQAAIEQLNVVGINDNPGEECIVVDYFLLYEIGDRIDTDKLCVFAGLDDTYLFFEDADGYRYELRRADLE